MGILHFFGHEGHKHGELPLGTIPWWQDELTVSVALILGFAITLLLTHYAFKAKFPITFTVMMVYLLIVGIACYSVAPILSIAALTAGITLALTTTMLTLAHKTTPK